MKLGELLTQEIYDKYGDMDISNDCIDDMACAWCGNLLTPAGRDKFKVALELEAEIAPVWGYDGIEVKIDHLKHYGKAWRQVKELFSAMCGYCTEEEYDEWFYDYGHVYKQGGNSNE